MDQQGLACRVPHDDDGAAVWMRLPTTAEVGPASSMEKVGVGSEGMTIDSVIAPASVRLDVWLWAARFFKTRSLCKQAIETGKVEVGGQRPKSSRALRVGEQLRVSRGEEVFEIVVRGLSEQRGPAAMAQQLYEESEASRARRAEVRALRAAGRDGYQPPEQRPDKRARRLIRALGDIDAM